MPISMLRLEALDRADWLIVPIWEEGLTPLAVRWDSRLGGAVTRLREAGDVSGKYKELIPLHNVDDRACSRLLMLGLGKRGEATRQGLTRAAMLAAKHLCGKRRGRIAVLLPDATEGLGQADLLLALVAGFMQGSRGPGIRKAEPDRFEPEAWVFVTATESSELQQAARKAEIAGWAVNVARDLVNEPPCDLYPESFARQAQELCSQAGVECVVLDERQIQQERMGCLLGVARGSVRPPRVVLLRYRKGASARTLGLVGKGVTFDSGGLSLKSNENMLDMKSDMAGAAAVLMAVVAVARLQIPVNVFGVLALVENLPSGDALKLGDVLRARNGKTAEVLNTDAEGRLILADALCYAVDQQVSHLVDLATLTGACMVALGTDVAGLMTNNPPWAAQVRLAAEQAGEKAWELPMFPEYGELIKSQVADIKNVGGKWGGAITAAKFLEHFVGRTPWAHLDIAGPSWVADDSPARDAGGTGCFVRTLMELAQRYDTIPA